MIAILFPGYLIALGFIIYWWVEDLAYPRDCRIQLNIMLFRDNITIADYVHSCAVWFYHLFVLIFTVYLIAR